MKKYPVALQLYSVRDFCEKDLEGTIKKVKEMGYDGVEFAGTFGRDAKALGDFCKEVGIVPISAHVAYYELISDISATVKYYADLGVKYIALPYMSKEELVGAESYAELLKNVKAISAECKKYGIYLLYHNHDFEFVKMPDGTYGLDYMYANTAPENLQTELDTCCFDLL